MKFSTVRSVPIRSSGQRVRERWGLKLGTDISESWKSRVDFYCLVDASPQRPRDSRNQQADIPHSPELYSLFWELPVPFLAPGVDSGAKMHTFPLCWELSGLGRGGRSAVSEPGACEELKPEVRNPLTENLKGERPILLSSCQHASPPPTPCLLPPAFG